MKNKKINLAFLNELAKHSEEYVLVSDDRAKILASDKDLKKLLTKIAKLKTEGGAIEYVPRVDAALSLLCP